MSSNLGPARSLMNSHRGANASTFSGFRFVEHVFLSSVRFNRGGRKSGDALCDLLQIFTYLVEVGALEQSSKIIR